MTNPNPFQGVVDFLAKMVEAYREVELNNLMTELEDFNNRNYKEVAIDVALATGDREAFEKLVGSELVMHIVERKSKETIRVIHNNLDAMEYGLSFLKQQGWSDNTRYSMTGIRLFEQELIGSGSISEIEQKYPEVEVQYPEKRDLLRSYPYIYVTEHEREVNK